MIVFTGEIVSTVPADARGSVPIGSVQSTALNMSVSDIAEGIQRSAQARGRVHGTAYLAIVLGLFEPTLIGFS